jgi:hypothetical protein
MNSQALAIRTGSAVKSDPVGSFKVILFFLIVVLAVFVFYKLFKGFGKVSDMISDLAPTSTAEKSEIISDPKYQDGVKWLSPSAGAAAIAKSGKYIETSGTYKGKSTVSAYLAAKGVTWDQINKASESMWKAKQALYLSTNDAYNVIAMLPTKAMVSIMAGVFNQKYDKKALIDGWPLDSFLSKFLDTEEMQGLVNIINKKPDL